MLGAISRKSAIYRQEQAKLCTADCAVAKPGIRNKMLKHIQVKVGLPNEDEKQAEALKTVHLRALRLAKEATDQEEASREVARTALKNRGPGISHSTPQVS